MSGFSFAKIAEERLARERQRKFLADRQASQEAQRQRQATPLLEFVPKVNPRFMQPKHLAAVAALFERAEHEPIRAVVSAPPRHGKSELLLMALARNSIRHPERLNCYVTYQIPFALDRSRIARDYAREAGAVLREDAQSLGNWRLREGGGLIATSPGGVLTGFGFDGLFIVDDPHKDRAHAESAVDRAFVQEWIRGTALTRIEPTGSVIIFHTRWHEDDLIGFLLRERIGGYDWEYVRLPAINEREEALWPERWPIELLNRRREEVGEYDWASQYQGTPQPKSGQLFGGVTFYGEKDKPSAEALPKDGYQLSVGVDFAYTQKTTGDFSVAVVCMRAKGITYVIDVVRMQALQPAFQAVLKARVNTDLLGAQWRAYVSTTEKGITDLAYADGLPINGMLATADKYVRASPVAAAWNAGKVRVPREAPWLDDFLRELQAFNKGRHDDQVDALAAAYDLLEDGGVIDYPTVCVPEDDGGIYLSED